ncbi:MAG: hypothetical protein IJX39_10195 [Clostridia bacterium]|nr:hypothetical protein [Clostridia bacterium]
MGLFGNKQQKLKDSNNAAKQQTLTQILTMSANCRNPQISAALNDIKRELESQGTSETKEGLALLSQTMTALNEANKYIIRGEVAPAANRLDLVKKLLAERRSHCTMGGTLTKKDQKKADKAEKMMKKYQGKGMEIEEDRSAQLELELAKLTADKEQIEKTLIHLKERLTRNPNDIEARNLWAPNESKYNITLQKINQLSLALNKETTRAGTKGLIDQGIELEAGVTVSDDENQANMDKLAQMQAKSAQDAAELQAQQQMMYGNGARMSSPADSPLFQSIGTGAAMGGVENGSLFQSIGNNNAAPGYGSMSSTGYGAPATGGYSAPTTNYSAATTNYGTSPSGGSFNRGEAARHMSEIRQAQSDLQKALEDCNDSMDDANEDLLELNAQLKPLLLRRREASPSECLVLDGQIDQLNVKRNGVQHKIQRYRNRMAQLSERLQLLEKLELQEDMVMTDAQLNQRTGGKFSDFGAIATYLKEAIAKSNESLEEIGMANAVVDSEQVNTNSFSGSNPVYSEMTGTKDEDRYKALEMDLGLATN